MLRTEKKLLILIEKIIARALNEQQKNLFNTVSGKFEKAKQQIAGLKKKINEVRQSIEHTKNVLEDKAVRAWKRI